MEEEEEGEEVEEVEEAEEEGNLKECLLELWLVIYYLLINFKEIGTLVNRTPKELIFKASCKDMPMFNQVVYLEKNMNNTSSLGKIDEVLGPVNEFMFSVTPKEGINMENIKDGTKIYLDQNFFLPMTIFTEPNKTKRISKPSGRGGRGGSGGRGGMNNGRGFSRGRGAGGRGFTRGRGNMSRGGGRGFSRGRGRQ